MSKPIVLSEKTWANIYRNIAQNYPPSVLLIRDKMRSVLGFTTRTHDEWMDSEVNVNDVSYGTRWRVTTIHLDFYSEPKRTMFLLKYSEYLEKDGKTVLDIE
jgi:hypothetical protein